MTASVKVEDRIKPNITNKVPRLMAEAFEDEALSPRHCHINE